MKCSQFAAERSARIEAIKRGTGRGSHEVRVLKGSSSKTKLHELGHARLGHLGDGGRTLDELIDRELDAEMFAWLASDRKLTPRMGHTAVLSALTNRPDLDVVGLVNLVSRKLEIRGIRVGRDDRRWFIDTCFRKTDDFEIEWAKEETKNEFY